MNTECPNCGMDNAYHNGVCYACPDCDYEWPDGLIFDDEEDDDDDKDEDDDIEVNLLT